MRHIALVVGVGLGLAGCVDKQAQARAAAAAPHAQAAQKALEVNDFPRAVAAAELAARYDPLDPALQDLLVRASLTQATSMAQALTVEQAARLDYQAEAMEARDSANAWLYQGTRGYAAFARGDLPKAESYLRASLAARADFPPAQLLLGLVLDASRQRDEAITLYEKFLAANPKHPSASASLGKLLVEKGDMGRAAGLLFDALAGQDSAAVRVNLGIALSNTGNLDGAIGHLERAVQLDPKLAVARLRLAEAYLAAARLKDAEAAFQAAAGLGAEPYGTRGVGLARMQAKNFPGALEAFGAVLKLAPDDTTSLFMAAEANEAAKNAREAARLYGRFAELAAANPTEVERVAVAKDRASRLGGK